MPVYEYNCKSHGKFDMLVKMAEADRPQRCPECAELSTRVEISGSTFHLKGDWFATTGDYGKKR